MPYHAYRLVANYAPWNADVEFISTFRQVKTNTVVGIYRCYELWTLVEQSRKLDGGIIEIGVWRGGSGSLIAKQSSLCGIESPVYLCDSFTGDPKATAKDSGYKEGEHADTSPEIVQALLDKYGLANVKVLPEVFPEQTAHLIYENQFRFRHIDVDTYQSTKDITDWIWDKMVVGGIIVHDD